MKIRTAAAALAAAMLSAAPLALQASSTFHPSPSESGTENHVSPGTLSKSQRDATERDEVRGQDPRWTFAGEAAGWELRPHSYEIRGGRVVHTDEFEHDTPRPPTEPETALHAYLRGGG